MAPTAGVLCFETRPDQPARAPHPGRLPPHELGFHGENRPVAGGVAASLVRYGDPGYRNLLGLRRCADVPSSEIPT